MSRLHCYYHRLLRRSIHRSVLYSTIALTSPMADASLTTFMKKTLTAIVSEVNKNGEKGS